MRSCVTIKMMVIAIVLHNGQKGTRFTPITSLCIINITQCEFCLLFSSANQHPLEMIPEKIQGYNAN